jgi:hypothetical protein
MTKIVTHLHAWMCNESGPKYELQNEIYYLCTFNLENVSQNLDYILGSLLI